MLMRYATPKKKHEPDVEFIAQFSLSACVDRLEDLGRSELADELHIQVDPIDTEMWVFRASRKTLGKITVEASGSLLKKDELSTLVIIKGYLGEETAQWVNAIFILILLVILVIISIFVYARAWVLALFVGLLGILPLFNWRFIDFDIRSRTERQRLQQLIKRTLE